VVAVSGVGDKKGLGVVDDRGWQVEPTE
jgi:hypothetical protein